MGLLGRKKKKKEAEELKAKLKALEDEPGEDVLPEPPKVEKEVGEATLEVKGNFSLNENEMALAVNALASSEEFKLYQQMVIGQQIADIIAAYNKTVGGNKSELSSSEDTDEEELPEPV